MYNKIKKGGTRGSGTAAEPLRPMASKLFNKKFAQSDSNHGLPRRTAGLLPGVQPIFMIHAIFLEDIVSGVLALRLR